ncbi:MAG: hypothetical protein KIS67_27205 [Verrucomicrobiae bacterium]|nr:hypothetical protein [Verrucomicrobiae bacterium]
MNWRTVSAARKAALKPHALQTLRDIFSGNEPRAASGVRLIYRRFGHRGSGGDSTSENGRASGT